MAVIEIDCLQKSGRFQDIWLRQELCCIDFDKIGVLLETPYSELCGIFTNQFDWILKCFRQYFLHTQTPTKDLLVELQQSIQTGLGLGLFAVGI